MQQMIEQQKRDTVDKILNESGRKKNNQSSGNNNDNQNNQQNENENEKSKKKRGIAKVLEGEIWKYKNSKNEIRIEIPKESEGIRFYSTKKIEIKDIQSRKCRECGS